MKDEYKKICRAISDWYGIRKQTLQAVQELSELICVLTSRKDQQGDDYKDHFTDEIADVEIMLEQIKHLYHIAPEALDERIRYKLDRQKTRIEDEVRNNPCIPWSEIKETLGKLGRF